MEIIKLSKLAYKLLTQLRLGDMTAHRQEKEKPFQDVKELFSLQMIRFIDVNPDGPTILITLTQLGRDAEVEMLD